ncbi:hypothetical protein HKD37_18G052166 [Glycine soja]|nr:hypothetical protein GmHk_18G053349 [Glycine max]
MGRWMKPEVYPLLAAMTFVSSMCVFQLTRNMLGNPDVRRPAPDPTDAQAPSARSNRSTGPAYMARPARDLNALSARINKTRRSMPVLDNREEGEKYAEHGLRKFLRTRPPEIMPTINHFFSEDK